MTKKYLILSNTQVRGTRSPFSGPGGLAFIRPLTFFPQELPEPKISIEALNKNQLMDLGKAPEVIGMAPIMPMRLVTPMGAKDIIMENNKISWGVNVTGAANSPYTGKDIKIAVLDTGIDFNHEAFIGMDLLQKDFTQEGDGDLYGHGSHCAGTIFGRPKNNFRYSIAPGIQHALIGKIINKNGEGETSWMYKAILWAIEEGAHIISMSVGFDFPGMVDHLVNNENYPIKFATSIALEAYRTNLDLFEKYSALVRGHSSDGKKAILVAAAGNENEQGIHPNYEITVSPPAAAEGIISVGALQKDEQLPQMLKVADFSNTGPIACAPGVDIESVKAGGGYISMAGTSMATPHVAGIAALWAEKLLKTSGSVDPKILSAKVIGQARKDQFVSNIDHADIGAGLVQAPLE